MWWNLYGKRNHDCPFQARNSGWLQATGSPELLHRLKYRHPRIPHTTVYFCLIPPSFLFFFHPRALLLTSTLKCLSPTVLMGKSHFVINVQCDSKIREREKKVLKLSFILRVLFFFLKFDRFLTLWKIDRWWCWLTKFYSRVPSEVREKIRFLQEEKLRLLSIFSVMSCQSSLAVYHYEGHFRKSANSLQTTDFFRSPEAENGMQKMKYSMPNRSISCIA